MRYFRHSYKYYDIKLGTLQPACLVVVFGVANAADGGSCLGGVHFGERGYGKEQESKKH